MSRRSFTPLHHRLTGSLHLLSDSCVTRGLTRATTRTRFRLRPIGVIHTQATKDEVRRSDHDLKSTIEIFPEFAEGLKGIDGYSHLFVICYFHQLRPEQKGVLHVRPRRYLRDGLSLAELPLIGVFALNSPSRPNPVGLTTAKVLRRRGRRISVKGLDFFDGTPVLDIKPYRKERKERVRAPKWSHELDRRAKLLKRDAKRR